MKSAMLVAATLSVALLLPDCGPKPRKVREPARQTLVKRCGLTDAPLSREQALCVAHAAKVGLVDGAYTLEAGTSPDREAIWVLRETCDARNPRCVEIWIRRADGAVVNTRWLHTFEDYDRLSR